MFSASSARVYVECHQHLMILRPGVNVTLFSGTHTLKIEYDSYCMSLLEFNARVSLKRVTLKELRALQFKSFLKCMIPFNVMYISLTDLNIQKNDDTTYVSVIVIDPMQRPEKTLTFDKNNQNGDGKWIQVGFKKSTKLARTESLSGL